MFLFYYVWKCPWHKWDNQLVFNSLKSLCGGSLSRCRGFNTSNAHLIINYSSLVQHLLFLQHIKTTIFLWNILLSCVLSLSQIILHVLTQRNQHFYSAVCFILSRVANFGSNTSQRLEKEVSKKWLNLASLKLEYNT